MECQTYYDYNPYLESIESFGAIANPAQKKGAPKEHEIRAKHNRKRCRKMCQAVKQNHLNREKLIEWWNSKTDLTDDQIIALSKLRHDLDQCCKISLFRQHKSNNSIDFIGSHTCKNKLCAVCNAKRSKTLQRNYRRFFEAYPELLEGYDLLHLTLTTPHTVDGFRGQRWYGDVLMREFNLMRKKPFWQKRVYAGEFGLEVTRNENGLHIHVHALLLVHKSKQNRNELHRKILLAWNKQTADKEAEFEPLPVSRKEAIQKSNALLTEKELNKINATGATQIGLESLYILSDEKRPGYHYCEREKAYKKYVSLKDGMDTYLKGVTETLKYHFHPIAMKKDGELDFELLAEILVAIKGKPLYRKFGAFHSGTKNAHPAAKSLNIKSSEEDLTEEIKEILEESAHQEVLNPETGEKALPEHFQYFLCSLAYVYTDPEDKDRIKLSLHARVTTLSHCRTMPEALHAMMVRGVEKQMSARQLPPQQSALYADRLLL